METDDGPARRSTRAALAEIPLRLGMLRVSPEPRRRSPEPPRLSPEPLTPINLNNLNANAGQTMNGFGDTARHIFANGHRNHNITPTSSAFLSPTPSPDELVIQQRGRRRIPVNWSPDIDYRKNSPFHSNNRTPPRAVMNLQSPIKNGIVLRSTPRKRLLMNDFDKPTSSSETVELNDMTPQKYRNQSPTKNSPAPKRFKIDRSVNLNSKEPLEVVLRAMSHDQLIDILKNVAQKHPNVEDDIRNNLPSPDLKPVEEKLSYLKRNIFRSLPTSRLYSKTDSPAYSRAATHIMAFKKYLIEQGKIFVDSHNWHSVLEYAILAWSYVRGTPHWDNHPHNAVRRHCFKYLAGLCMNALKRDEFEHETMLDIHEKFESMITDSDDIRSCLKFVSVQIKTAPQNINNNNNSLSVGRRCI